MGARPFVAFDMTELQREASGLELRVEELVGLHSSRPCERVRGVGVFGAEVVLGAVEAVDRAGGADADADAVDVEIGVPKR